MNGDVIAIAATSFESEKCGLIKFKIVQIFAAQLIPIQAYLEIVTNLLRLSNKSRSNLKKKIVLSLILALYLCSAVAGPIDRLSVFPSIVL